MEILRRAQDDRGCPIRSGMTERAVPLQHIFDDSINVQGDDFPAAFVGFQEEAVVGVVVEEILREGCTTAGILQDIEVALPVGIAVGVVLPERVSREPECSGAVEEISLLVSGGLATGGVADPAAGGHPLLAVAGSVGVDGDQADISLSAVLQQVLTRSVRERREMSYSSGVSNWASKSRYWRCRTTAAAISHVYLYSRNTPSGEHYPVAVVDKDFHLAIKSISSILVVCLKYHRES